MAHKLDSLFNPKSVAVIGASENPQKIGHRTLRLLLDHKYHGRVYPINPTSTKILDLTAYPNLKDVDDEVDLALIVTPARTVPDIIRDCGEKGVKFAIIFSAGFSEVGTEGKRLEQEIVKTARQNGVGIVGPNCMGIVNVHSNLCASFGSAMKREHKEGPIAFLTQSGAFGGALFAWAQERGVGFSKFISSGNEADLDCADYLDYLKDDEHTRVIVVYMEGVDNGRKLLETLKEVTPVKPVVVLKVGRSKAGARAAASHTGSLSGSDKVYDGMFRQAGVIRVWDVEELFDVGLALAHQPTSKGTRIGIITTAGGLGVEATDSCEEVGLQVPVLSERVRQALRAILPSFASVNNPIDTTAQIASNLGWMENLVSLVLSDEEIDGLLVTLSARSERELARGIIKVSQEIRDKPILVSWTYGKQAEPAIQLLMKNCIPVYATPERAAKAMSSLYRYAIYESKTRHCITSQASSSKDNLYACR